MYKSIRKNCIENNFIIMRLSGKAEYIASPIQI